MGNKVSRLSITETISHISLKVEFLKDALGNSLIEKVEGKTDGSN